MDCFNNVSLPSAWRALAGSYFIIVTNLSQLFPTPVVSILVVKLLSRETQGMPFRMAQPAIDGLATFQLLNLGLELLV